jgi:hypothetical protein
VLSGTIEKTDRKREIKKERKEENEKVAKAWILAARTM